MREVTVPSGGFLTEEELGGNYPLHEATWRPVHPPHPNAKPTCREHGALSGSASGAI